MPAKELKGSSAKRELLEHSPIETAVVMILTVLALGFVSFTLKNYL